MSIDAVGTVEQKQKSPLLYGAGGAAIGALGAGGYRFLTFNPLKDGDTFVRNAIETTVAEPELKGITEALTGLKEIAAEGADDAGKKLKPLSDAAKKALEKVGLTAPADGAVGETVVAFMKDVDAKRAIYEGASDATKSASARSLKENLESLTKDLAKTGEKAPDPKTLVSRARKFLEDLGLKADKVDDIVKSDATEITDLAGKLEGAFNNTNKNQILELRAPVDEAVGKVVPKIYKDGALQSVDDKADDVIKKSYKAAKEAVNKAKLNKALWWGIPAAIAVGVVAALVVSSKNKKAAAEAQAPAQETALGTKQA